MARTGVPTPRPEVMSELESKQPDCGRCSGPRGTAFQVEHILPRTKGGTDHISNLRPICNECARKRPRTKMLNLRIDWEVWDSLRELAQQRGVTASDLVQGMIDFAMTDASGNAHLIEIKQTVSKLNALVDIIEANPPYSRRRRNAR